MAPGKKQFPDFFEDAPIDPVHVATGKQRRAGKKGPRPFVEKRKVGFYLSTDTIDRFNRTFHRLKLAGSAIENKSALVELAIAFALDDLDKGDDSRLMKKMGDGL
jgi:hypothetical protein